MRKWLPIALLLLVSIVYLRAYAGKTDMKVAGDTAFQTDFQDFFSKDFVELRVNACTVWTDTLTSDNSKSGTLHSDLIGTWCLTTHEVNYPALTFQKDSIAEFASRGDTIYFFRYCAKNDCLYLTGDSVVTENRIAKLTKDSLIFANLLEHKVRQVYFRCNR